MKKGKTAHSKEKITNINAHTEKNESNAVVSLNQLRDTLPRVKWVSPTINWFATSLDAKDCEVLPGVEFRDGNITTTPNSWKVAGFERHNARLITQKKKSPIYDGTTNDASILRYLQTLKNRGYKVMLYPMMLVDNIKKPWRGRIHANSAQDINHFFDSKNGYKKFIIHYANLAKGHVDAFIIGSELIGLTKFKDKDNKFPAVDKLIELAGEVKKILGSSVKISYGADWSEYHHTDGGWYNLDKLWASPNIDFVGIDAYFPLTDSNNTVMNHKEVMLGWDSGEGFDYHFDHAGKKQPLAKEYAWKNIEWWWGNPHFNPDGKRTEWQPKAKKIWFTEVGFPSIDCATNQPSVSFDPYGSESAVPKYSRGKIDFYAQKVGLLATELRWKNSEMVENKFVWAWDARPYPYWPDRSDVWPDAACWFTGYWIQGKLGQSTLREMLAEICMKSGINENQFNVNLINKHISGFYIFNHTTARDVIDNLRELYCFDVVDDGGVICFIPRENKQVYQIDYGDVIMAKNGKSTFCTQSVSGSERISRICLNYIKQEHAFILTNVYADDNMAHAKNNKNLSIPIVFQEADAKDIVNKMMKNIMSGRILYEFVLPIKYIFLKPSDVVKIEYNNQDHLIRLTNISITSQQTIKVFGIAESEDNIA